MVQCACTKFYFEIGKNSIETLEFIILALKNVLLSRVTLDWFKRFDDHVLDVF